MNSIGLLPVHCLMCHSPISESSREYLIDETMFRIGQSFCYRECEQCGSVNLAETVSSETKLYPDNYYSFSVDPVKTFDSFLPRFVATAMAVSSLKGNRFFLTFMFRYAPIREVRTLASIFCQLVLHIRGRLVRRFLMSELAQVFCHLFSVLQTEASRLGLIHFWQQKNRCRVTNLGGQVLKM